MTNPFAVQFEASAARTLLRLHGESVVYYKSDGSDPSTLQALIERDPVTLAAIINEGSGGAIVGLLNDETDGMDSQNVDTNGDMIELAMQVGQCAERRQVLKIISSNGGLTRLLV